MAPSAQLGFRAPFLEYGLRCRVVADLVLIPVQLYVRWSGFIGPEARDRVLDLLTLLGVSTITTHRRKTPITQLQNGSRGQLRCWSDVLLAL